MRYLYLTMLSRATYEEDDEWRDIQNFYKGLSQDDERALVLTPLARETDAMPLLWDALGRNEKLGRSAVNGLLSLAKRAQSSPEQVGGFLLAKLQESSGQHQQDRAIETLSRLPFSSAWRDRAAQARTAASSEAWRRRCAAHSRLCPWC